jgi:hypothetical protein
LLIMIQFGKILEDRRKKLGNEELKIKKEE